MSFGNNLDAIGYYYQVKIRGTMEAIRQRLKDRNSSQIVTVGGEPIIAPIRTQRRWLRHTFDAFINHSMWLYALMVGIDVILWRLFVMELIR